MSEESDQSWDLIQQASAIEGSDPAAAFRLYLEAAEAGSIWSLEAVGWRYWTGTGVAADPAKAQDFYRRAISGGSWMATIHYARLLAEYHRQDECEQVLKEGVASNFTPACFWLARFQYDRLKTRQAAREVRPMLERAARAGHPGAQFLLAVLMLTGKFGLRGIPNGLKMYVRGALNYASGN